MITIGVIPARYGSSRFFLRRLANALLGTGALDPIDFDNASPLVLIRDGGRFRIEAYAKNAIIA